MYLRGGTRNSFDQRKQTECFARIALVENSKQSDLKIYHPGGTLITSSQKERRMGQRKLNLKFCHCGAQKASVAGCQTIISFV